MQNDHEDLFANAMMGGLFLGIIDTVILLAYNVGYREFTGYTPSALVNVSSLIFAVNLLSLATGIVYFLFSRLFHGKDAIYFVLSVLFTIFLVYRTEISQRFTDTTVNNEAKGLLLGIVLVLGGSSILLPVFVRSKFFEKHVF